MGPSASRPMEVSKVLIIDDEPASGRALEAILEKEGFRVVRGSDGPGGRALAVLEKPHLILLDLHLPGEDGIETCRKLKGDPETSQIPVIFISARKSPDDERTGLDAGAVDYFPKPLDMDRLIARIRQILEERMGTAVPATP